MKQLSRVVLTVAMAMAGFGVSAWAQKTGEVTKPQINVRGQPTISSEVVGSLKKGDAVTILDSIKHTKVKADDSTNWFKIAMPANIRVWLNGAFLSTNDSTVLPPRLNLRSGPGENFSVVGRLAKGDTVKVLREKGEWLQIEAPATAYAFVAAELVEVKEAPVAPPTPVIPVITETNMVAAPATPVVETPTAPVIPATPTTNETRMVVDLEQHLHTNTNGPMVTRQIIEVLPPARRVVAREGIVKPTYNIQAPSGFVLEEPETEQVINYLHTTDTNVVLRGFRFKRVFVTGEESIERRWPNTPLLHIETILEAPTNATPAEPSK
jgi:uncharacterized protein YgiM (DUF1202 family)